MVKILSVVIFSAPDVAKVVEIKSDRKGGALYHSREIQEVRVLLLQFKLTNE
jgi:hypothetical protein